MESNKETVQWVMERIGSYRSLGITSATVSIDNAVSHDFMKFTRVRMNYANGKYDTFDLVMEGFHEGIKFHSFSYGTPIETLRKLAATRADEMIAAWVSGDKSDGGLVHWGNRASELEDDAGKIRMAIAQVRVALRGIKP